MSVVSSVHGSPGATAVSTLPELGIGTPIGATLMFGSTPTLYCPR